MHTLFLARFAQKTMKHVLFAVEDDCFDNAMWALREEKPDASIEVFDDLKERSIQLLREDNLMLALHILNAIYDSSTESDWYAYDYDAGTTMTPHCLVDVDDVEKWIGFDKE